jgi:hypothetical protein
MFNTGEDKIPELDSIDLKDFIIVKQLSLLES